MILYNPQFFTICFFLWKLKIHRKRKREKKGDSMCWFTPPNDLKGWGWTRPQSQCSGVSPKAQAFGLSSVTFSSTFAGRWIKTGADGPGAGVPVSCRHTGSSYTKHTTALAPAITINKSFALHLKTLC